MTLSEYEVRQQKVAALKEAGIVPYANKFERTHTIAELRKLAENYNTPAAELLMEEGAENTYSIAGRVVMFRSHGKLSFATIRDRSGDIQIAFVKDLCKLYTGYELVGTTKVEGQELGAYKFAEKYLDVADFIGVRGELFVTQHGELTLFVNEYQLLSKALRPLGDKRHGVNDIETLYRQRYLDLTMNEETYERFLLRSKFIQFLRQFYREHGFVEIETPVLGSSASGAAAKPFITHHNDFDEDFYLRIATEIGLKKATVGRFERVFEIGKQFRNEGSDPSHLQEFTSVEHYTVYWNFEDNMKFTQDMFAYLFAHLGISEQVTVKDKEGVAKVVDFSGEWEKIDYIEGVKRESGIDVTAYENDLIGADRLRKDIRAKGIEFSGMEEMSTTTLIDYLYKKVLRPKILGPAFVYNYPKTMQPLARQSDKNPNIVEQFQLVVNGREIIKAYSELVDPAVQQANFEEQADAQERGDDEATADDDDFILAMEHGMPPQSGWGLGIDRIITLLTQQDNLRDVILFPLVKPENAQKVGMGRSKETKIAVAVVNVGIGLELRQEMNTVAHLNAAFGGRRGKELFMQDEIVTKDGEHIKLNIQHAIMLKQAPNSQTLRELVKSAKNMDVEVTEFTKEMIETTDDRKVVEWTSQKEHKDIEYLGVLLFGNKKSVDELTAVYGLYGKGDGGMSSDATEEKQPKEAKVKAEDVIAEPLIDALAYGELPSVGQVHGLVDRYLTETKRHCEQVGEVMRRFAKKLGQPEELRWMAGIMHDIDRDHIGKDGNKHLKVEFETIMDEINVPRLLRDDIKSHGDWLTGVPADSLLRKYLISIDELSGFLYAYSRMRPTGFEGMDAAGVKKRLKDKAFAAGVDRVHVVNCEKYLGIPFDQFVVEVIEAMKGMK